MSDRKPRVLVVTGMHRSGTSVAASLLQSAGLHVGERLLGPNPSNVRGHFENLDFVEFHEEVLRSQGRHESGWTLEGPLTFDEGFRQKAAQLIAKSAVSPRWGWKDPRTVLFLRAWADLLPEAVFLLVHRSPWDVVDSLLRRSSAYNEVFLQEPALAIDFWTHYNRQIASFHDEHPERCLVASVHTMTRTPQAVVEALNDRFGLGLAPPAPHVFEEPLLQTSRERGYRFLAVRHAFPDALRLYRDLLARSVSPLSEVDRHWLSELEIETPQDRNWPFQGWVEATLGSKREGVPDAEEVARADAEERDRLTLQLVEARQETERAQAAVEQAQNDVAATRAQAEQASAQLAATRTQSEQARAQLAIMRATVEQTRAQLEATRVELGRTQLDVQTGTGERLRLQTELAVARGRLNTIDTEGLRPPLARLKGAVRRRLRAEARAWSAKPRAAWRRVASALRPSPRAASLAVADFEAALGAALARYEEAGALEAVRISILTPTWNTRLRWLLETAQGVLGQSTTAWEWCLVDDGSSDEDLRAALNVLARKVPRVRLEFAERGGISAATNRALALAHGEYVCFLDHDDVLAPTALAEVLEKLAEGWDAVYTDQDKIDASGQSHHEPFHKPDWSPEYLRGVMYVGHLLAVRRRVAQGLIGFRSEFDGVQDFEFTLRLSEAGARVGHVPKILYHWRQAEGSVAADPGAKPGIERLQRKAVNAHLQRLRLPAEAQNGNGSHRVKIVPAPRSHHPLVSLIIPTRDAPEFLETCLTGLYARTTYPSFEVVLVDNESRDPRALELMERFPVQRVPLPDPFNYSRANNLGARRARGAYLVFLNNDTDVISADWIEQLLYYAEQPGVGAVGGLLLYGDRTVQHAGVVLGFRGTADHVMRGWPAGIDGYAGSLACAREVSAVTGACMMVETGLYWEMGGFNEHFATHYQDVDLCLRFLRAGRRNIFTPRAVLHHFESVTRSSRYDLLDRMLLLDLWQDRIEAGDPFYNANFDLSRTDYAVLGA
jgi:GT2 family glycosyltransferase